MNRNLKHAFALGVLGVFALLGVAAQAQQFSFDEEFNGPTFSPLLTMSNTPGFSQSLSNGFLVIDKTAGTTSGSGELETTFSVTGDFTADTQVTRNTISGGSASAGINASGLGDIFFYENGNINGNILQPSFGYVSVNNSVTADTFRLQRIGNTFSEYYDGGAGFVLLNSRTDPSLSGPTQLSLFMIEETNNPNTRQAQFNYLHITAGGAATPAPSSVLVVLLGAVPLVGALRRRRK